MRIAVVTCDGAANGQPGNDWRTWPSDNEMVYDGNLWKDSKGRDNFGRIDRTTAEIMMGAELAADVAANNAMVVLAISVGTV